MHPTRRPLLGLLSLSLATTLLAQSPVIVDEIDSARQNLRDALAYRDQAATELAAWEIREEQLQNLITIATGEKAQLESELAHSQPELDALREKIALLEKDSKEAIETDKLLQEHAPSLARSLLQQSSSWPEPLRRENLNDLHKLKTQLASLSETPSTPEQSANLLRAALEVLSNSLAFESSFYRGTTHRSRSDGQELLYSVLYIGTAQGYYYSETLGQSGTIDFDNGNWTWNEDPTLLTPLLDFDRILEKEVPAHWIPLPFQIKEGGEQQ